MTTPAVTPDVSEQAPQADQNIATGNQQQPTTQAPQVASLVQSQASDANAQRPTFNSQEPSTFRRVLLGALSGLAHGGIIGAGVGAAQAGTETPEQYSQAKLEQADVNTNRIKMRDLASATAAANFTHLSDQYHQQDQAAQDAHQDHVNEWMKFNRDNFGIQYDAIPNNTGGEAVLNYLQQSANQDPTGQGAHVPQGSLVGPHEIFAPRVDTGTADQHFKMLQDLSVVTNSPAPTRDQFNRMSPAQQDAASSSLLRTAMGRDPDGKLIPADNIPDAISNLHAGLTTLQQQPDHTVNPDLVTRIQGTIANLTDQLNSHNANKTGQAVSTANAEQPGKIQLANLEARNKQQVDNEQQPVYAYDPQSNEYQATDMADAKARGMKIPVKVTGAEMSTDKALSNRLADVEQKIGQYQQTYGTDLSLSDKKEVAEVLGPNLKLDLWGAHLPTDFLSNIHDAAAHGKMSDAAQQRLVAFYNANEALMGYQRVLTGSARSSETQLELQQKTLPSPVDAPRYANTAIDQFKQNIDVAGQGMPRFPGIPTHLDIRKKLAQK